MGQNGSSVFLKQLFKAIHDEQPIVRTCAADTLYHCLTILVERRQPSLTALLCQVHSSMMEGLSLKVDTASSESEERAAQAVRHGSLLVVSTVLSCTGEFMIPRFEEVCRAVLALSHGSVVPLLRLEVIRLIPRLASRCPHVFGRRRYLDESVSFLMESAVEAPTSAGVIDIRPSAFASLGQLMVAMTTDRGEVIGGSDLPTLRILDDTESQGRIVELRRQGIIFEKLDEIFTLVKAGLRISVSAPGSPVMRAKNSVSSATAKEDTVLRPALNCAASLVAALGNLAQPFLSDLIDEMFQAGLSHDLIQCLQSIAISVPDKQSDIEERILQKVSLSLAGARRVYDPLSSPAWSGKCKELQHQASPSQYNGQQPIRINYSESEKDVRSLVLSLQTLASFGGTIRRANASGKSVPLLPFVQTVASRYLSHPSSDVRRAAAITCCALLLPFKSANENVIMGHTGVIVNDVIGVLLRVAISDSSAHVRICVIGSLDSRYDPFLAQRQHLMDLFLLLQDESLTARSSGLRLLGRLAEINPAPVLPVLRQFLKGVIVELQCGVNIGKEESTRLLVVFLRAKSLQRLIHPVLESVVRALPLDSSSPPRLASASLEALGELAQASGASLKPWIKDIIPHVLEIMQDQSSASKQRTSLRTLGQIASSTGYVIQPYLDYPRLLSEATDILPATKRAPWSLRREVMRTLGILGALDPDRYHSVASKRLKGGAIGSAYFEETETWDVSVKSQAMLIPRPVTAESMPVIGATPAENGRKQSFDGGNETSSASDEDLPAYLFMHEQYTMIAQPMSDVQPTKRLTPADEDFFPTVSVQALMHIFCDPNLAAHHGMAIQAVMFIFKYMGMGCVPFLRKVVPQIIIAIKACESSNLRESLLKQLTRLSLIVREHLRPYVADIFNVIEGFWSSRHLATIFGLISNIAVAVPDAFKLFLPRFIQHLVVSFDELQVADWSEARMRVAFRKDNGGTERLRLLLQCTSDLKSVLKDYLHILVPALLQVADSIVSLGSDIVLEELSVSLFRTVTLLLDSQNAAASRVTSHHGFDSALLCAPKNCGSSEKGLPSRVVQPLLRLFREKRMRSQIVAGAIVDTLCACAKHIGRVEWARLYQNVVGTTIAEWELSQHVGEADFVASRKYSDFIRDFVQTDNMSVLGLVEDETSSLFIRNISSTEMTGPTIDSAPEPFEQQQPFSPSGPSRHRANYRNLQRSWDVSQRSSREDWDEWMRRFSIQLLREAPSPALRSTASLAHAYQPLARELFSAAFACCWNELSDPYKTNLVHALETAFVADVSPEILQALLNLAEFMEHDPKGGLPIAVPILADLALKCRAYGKALHYKEKEYAAGGGSACVESLISINRKLDLQGKLYSFSFSLVVPKQNTPIY